MSTKIEPSMNNNNNNNNNSSISNSLPPIIGIRNNRASISSSLPPNVKLSLPVLPTTYINNNNNNNSINLSKSIPILSPLISTANTPQQHPSATSTRTRLANVQTNILQPIPLIKSIKTNSKQINFNLDDKTEIKFEDGLEYDAVCPHDNLHFSSVKEWKNHHISKHMDTKWKCPLCSTVSASWHNYSYHVQIQEHNGICPPPWICKLRLPLKITNNKKAHSTINSITGNDIKHKHKHKPVKSNKICEKRFGSKYQLLRHMKSEHPNYSIIETKIKRHTSYHNISTSSGNGNDDTNILSLPTLPQLNTLPTLSNNNMNNNIQQHTLPIPNIIGIASTSTSSSNNCGIKRNYNQLNSNNGLLLPTITGIRSASSSLSSLPLLPTIKSINNSTSTEPPIKKQRLSVLTPSTTSSSASISPISVNNNDTNINNKNGKKGVFKSEKSQFDFINLLCQAAQQEIKQDSNSNISSTKVTTKTENTYNNISTLGNISSILHNNSNNNGINGINNMTIINNLNALSLPNKLIGRNNFRIQYVAAPNINKNTQIIFTTRKELNTLKLNNRNNNFAAFHQFQPLQPIQAPTLNQLPTHNNNINIPQIQMQMQMQNRGLYTSNPILHNVPSIPSISSLSSIPSISNMRPIVLPQLQQVPIQTTQIQQMPLNMNLPLTTGINVNSINNIQPVPAAAITFNNININNNNNNQQQRQLQQQHLVLQQTQQIPQPLMLQQTQPQNGRIYFVVNNNNNK